MIEERIQRDVFEVVSLSQASDFQYWLACSPQERLEAIEFLRKVMFGRGRISQRLQRVLTIARLKGD